MPRVYRVENNFGIGPYWGGSGKFSKTLSNVHSSATTKRSRPAPSYNLRDYAISRLGLPMYSYDKLYYGCDSLKDLVYWFMGFLRPLFGHGYVIRVYEVKNSQMYYCNDGFGQVITGKLDPSTAIQIIDSYSELKRIMRNK